jgi:hypothetical protein
MFAHHIRIFWLTLSVLLCGTVFAAGIELVAVSPAMRVRQEGPVDGAKSASIASARGEYESFQVVVTARDGNLAKVNAEATRMRNANGEETNTIQIILYREVFVPVRHSAPRATEAPGLIADALVPFVNPYTGDAIAQASWGGSERTGPRFGASDFEVWQDHHQPLWVDVWVPANTAPGLYTATLTVRAGDVVAELPITLEVWDFELPSGPTHENHFGGFGSVASYLGLDANSEEFARIEERYAEMMAEHRLNPPLPSALHPEIGDDGTASFAPEVDDAISAFVNRFHVTNIDIPRAPFGDITGANKEKAINFYRSWYAYLASKGWADRSYLYMLDEPNDPEAYEQVRALGAVVHEAEPGIRRLVVEQPYTQNPEWGTLDEAIDIWCPLFGFIDEGSVDRVIAQGDDVWSYTALVQTAPPYHPEYETVKNDLPPFWQLDFPVASYRIAPWLNRRYHVTGLLYWSSVYWQSPERNPWDDPGFRIRWNGEGALFYPGNDAGIDGPIASIRLKNLRDGMEDYEYFAILDAKGFEEKVNLIVGEAVPTWGTWNRDPEKIDALRRKLAGLVVGTKQ